MSQTFQLEEGIPIPRMRQGRGKYPWYDMKIGQSFVVPCEEWESEQTMNSLTSCRGWAQKVSKKTFALRKVIGGVRVWRVR